MNPSDAHSSLAALQQLQELLDAGTITPAEFAKLKRQLIFGNEPPAPPAAPTPPPAAEADASPITPEPAGYLNLSPEVPVAPPIPPPAFDWLATAAPGLPVVDEASLPPLAERRNPLTLVFIAGGLLVLLGIVLFLFIDRPSNPDEHLTSASQTAADSVATVPEVGPQAQQLALPPATAPETIRVAPVARPAAPVASRSAAADSTVTAAPAAPTPAGKAPAPAVPATPPAKAPAATKPAPTSADTTKTP